MNKVAIIGVGLIGGSLGKRLRQAEWASSVIGCGRSLANLEVARKSGCIDEFTHDPAEAVRGADIVVVCTPVATISAIFDSISSGLEKDTIITDVGSTKVAIQAQAEETLPFPGQFVGGHPIAGTENSGAASAEEALFEGARWIIASGDQTSESAISTIKEMVSVTGAYVDTLSPARHDEIFGWVSHFPHFVAYALARTVGSESGDLFQYGGGGLRDFLRIAASDPDMWRDIFIANRQALQQAIASFDSVLSEFANLLDHPEDLHRHLAAVQRQVRNNLK